LQAGNPLYGSTYFAIVFLFSLPAGRCLPGIGPLFLNCHCHERFRFRQLLVSDFIAGDAVHRNIY
jgi:hypothetical protein